MIKQIDSRHQRSTGSIHCTQKATTEQNSSSIKKKSFPSLKNEQNSQQQFDSVKESFAKPVQNNMNANLSRRTSIPTQAAAASSQESSPPLMFMRFNSDMVSQQQEYDKLNSSDTKSTGCGSNNNSGRSYCNSISSYLEQRKASIQHGNSQVNTAAAATTTITTATSKYSGYCSDEIIIPESEIYSSQVNDNNKNELNGSAKAVVNAQKDLKRRHMSELVDVSKVNGVENSRKGSYDMNDSSVDDGPIKEFIQITIVTQQQHSANMRQRRKSSDLNVKSSAHQLKAQGIHNYPVILNSNYSSNNGVGKQVTSTGGIQKTESKLMDAKLHSTTTGQIGSTFNYGKIYEPSQYSMSRMIFNDGLGVPPYVPYEVERQRKLNNNSCSAIAKIDSILASKQITPKLISAEVGRVASHKSSCNPLESRNGSLMEITSLRNLSGPTCKSYSMLDGMKNPGSIMPSQMNSAMHSLVLHREGLTNIYPK